MTGIKTARMKWNQDNSPRKELAMKLTPPKDCVKCGHEGDFNGPEYEENRGIRPRREAGLHRLHGVDMPGVRLHSRGENARSIGGSRSAAGNPI